MKKQYGAIDGLRTIACIGIVMMHVAANSDYAISGFVYERLIPSFTDFVFLFMVISAFGMCYGYLDKIINGQITLEEFYKKRYSKILPFFALLVLMDIIISHSREALIEGFADITLLFGLFPNEISVVGVGWFLGLIFAFYLLFPFYCTLLSNKRRAWIMFIIALLLNFVCEGYFDVERTNIVYCLCYLMCGGLIYLYRGELKKATPKYLWIIRIVLCLGIIAYYYLGSNTVTCLLTSAMMLVYALVANRCVVLENCITKKFGCISMEVYLSHMVILRVIEKVGLKYIFGNGLIQYIFTVVLTVGGAIVFSVCAKLILKYITQKYQKNIKGSLYERNYSCERRR